MSSWFVAALLFFCNNAHAAQIEILDINFRDTTRYSTGTEPVYSAVIIDYRLVSGTGSIPSFITVTGVNYGAHIYVDFPHGSPNANYPNGYYQEMSVGENQGGGWEKFPGFDLVSAYQKTADWTAHPDIIPLTPVGRDWRIQSRINMDSGIPPALPDGYQGQIIVTDVRLPSNCKSPGTYTLSINGIEGSFTPAHKGVMCAELHDLKVVFSDPNYDAPNWVTFNFQVKYFNWTDNQDRFTLTFPQGRFPQVFQISDEATVILPGHFHLAQLTPTGTFTNSDGIVETLPEITSSQDPHVKLSPSFTHRTMGNAMAFWEAGSEVNITLTNVTNPWSCEENGKYCIEFGPFKTCSNPVSEISGCPIFKNLDLKLVSSRYGSKDADFRFTFDVTEFPLFCKDTYQIQVHFPIEAGYNISNTFVGRLPEGEDWRHHPKMFQHNPSGYYIENSPDQFVAFMLDCNDIAPTLDGQPTGNLTYVPAGTKNVNITISGGILPQHCEQVGPYNISIGPWLMTTDVDYELTGCTNLTNLDAYFSNAEVGGTNVSLTLEFDVNSYELWPDPVSVTVPYYTGSGRTILVHASPFDNRFIAVDGSANANLTLYRGATYVFDVDVSDKHSFAIMEVPAMGNSTDGRLFGSGVLYQGGTLYDKGIVNNFVNGSGSLIWDISEHAPTTLYYQDPMHPLMLGVINIISKPRGLRVENAVFGNGGGGMGTLNPWFGTLFTGQTVGKEWRDRDPPHVSYWWGPNTGDREESWTATLHGFDKEGALGKVKDGSPVPLGHNRRLVISEVSLPTLYEDPECTDFGNITVQVGLWSVSSNPMSDRMNCPRINNVEIRFSSHVRGQPGVVAYLTYDVEAATLDPMPITVFFPRWSGISLKKDANFFSVNEDWKLSRKGPTVRNIPGVEVSISQDVISGSPIGPNTSYSFNRTQIIIGGINLPLDLKCDDLGNYTIQIGPVRHTFNPTMDKMLCPNMTALEVMFTPTANHSAMTNAIVAFNLSDPIDASDEIVVGFPEGIDISQASFGVMFADEKHSNGWLMGDSVVRVSYIWKHLVISVRTGYRLKMGRHIFHLRDLRLPRGNCSDLGDWYVQIGLIRTTENPTLDVVENCVGIEDLIVTFEPDAEQGMKGVNMTFHYTIVDHALSYLPYDSDFIFVDWPQSTGVTLGARPQFVRVMGQWAPDEGNMTRISDTSLQQKFLGGNLVPAGTRTSFTIMDVNLPDHCLVPGIWTMTIGIWVIHASPINESSLLLCPKIVNLDVKYIKNDQCNEHVRALVSFDVEETRLRAGILRFDLPAHSGLILYPWARVLTGPAQWKPSSDEKIVPDHCIYEPGNEISFTQTFTGPALEVGQNYSFLLDGVGLPCNNCTDLGYYKLAVDKWSGPWTNPFHDTLRCPGLITGVNISVEPQAPPRRFNNATYLFRFTIPRFDEWNELRIQFPSGYQPGIANPVQIGYVKGLDISMATIAVENNVLQIRRVTATGETYNVWLEVHHIGLANNCDEGSFRISTHSCGFADRSAGQAPMVRWCWPADGDAIVRVESSITAKNCDICGACEVEFQDAAGNNVYSCQQDRSKFQRRFLFPGCTANGV